MEIVTKKQVLTVINGLVRQDKVKQASATTEAFTSLK